MLKRGLFGALIGMAITTSLAILCFGAFLGLEFAFGSPTPLARSLATGQKIVLTSMFIGLLGGIASRSSRHGMRILPSISIVAAFTMAGIFVDQITQPVHKSKDEPLIVFGTIAAFIGCTIVFLRGWNPKSPPQKPDVNPEETAKADQNSTNP